MNSISIPWAKDDRPGVKANCAVEMARWCKEQGLQHGVDFDWYYEPARQCTRFRFYGVNESVTTMFALRWLANEI